MSAIGLLTAGLVCLLAGYVFYGRFLVRKFNINPQGKTPAHTCRDGVDYEPTKPFVLLGHHFASIAGAGPILGPVFAAAFGWLPVFLWIVIGSIFIGGVHDFASLVSSIRHRGHSIAELIDKYIGTSGKRLFLGFTWFMLVLIIAVFAQTIASTFIKNPSVASSSFLFIALAVIFGLAIHQWKLPFWPATILGIILLGLCIVLGLWFPLGLSYNVWIVILFAYVFVAAVTPVWILLQPRDFLNSFLLYAILIAGVFGIFIARPSISMPVFTSFHTNLGTLFPVLFVTMACGAVSGFHSLVASGTTSKQLDRERDARVVGYGGMLIEGLLAIVALITANVLLPKEYQTMIGKEGGGPISIFASGIGKFMLGLGIPHKAGMTFAALAISAFAMTTLDTATRLGRFILQEMCEGSKGTLAPLSNRFVSTTITLVAAGLLAFSGTSQTLWPIFGSANQLMAAIALLAISVWLRHLKEKNLFVRIPMFFMMGVTLTALGFLILKNILDGQYLLTVFSLLLLGVAVSMVIQAALKRVF
jgi:carbon starvation protein